MESRPLFIFTIVQIVAIAAILWIVFSIPGAWDLQRIIGTALMLIGIGGIVTARFQLGKSFAITAKAHQLVTHGIYSKIRNPIYVSGAVMLVGF
ncbi:MAG: methyltransferase, partial [Candidatus Sulfotelmatobacter sp.]